MLLRGFLACAFGCVVVDVWAGDFLNLEVPPVHPVDLSPDGRLLAVCHTADNRVLLFSLVTGEPVLAAAVTTGLDPVSVRWRTADELWVVNHTSDSVSVVDAARRMVTQTLQTADESADVVFAGTPQRAWVSCSQVNRLQVFDAATPAATLSWMAAPYEVFEIRWSNSLVAWTPLATGRIDAGPAGGSMSWTDDGPPHTPASSAATPRRFYKLERVR